MHADSTDLCWRQGDGFYNENPASGPDVRLPDEGFGPQDIRWPPRKLCEDDLEDQALIVDIFRENPTLQIPLDELVADHLDSTVQAAGASRAAAALIAPIVAEDNEGLLLRGRAERDLRHDIVSGQFQVQLKSLLASKRGKGKRRTDLFFSHSRFHRWLPSMENI